VKLELKLYKKVGRFALQIYLLSSFSCPEAEKDSL